MEPGKRSGSRPNPQFFSFWWPFKGLCLMRSLTWMSLLPVYENDKSNSWVAYNHDTFVHSCTAMPNTFTRQSVGKPEDGCLHKLFGTVKWVFEWRMVEKRLVLERIMTWLGLFFFLLISHVFCFLFFGLVQNLLIKLRGIRNLLSKVSLGTIF